MSRPQFFRHRLICLHPGSPSHAESCASQRPPRDACSLKQSPHRPASPPYAATHSQRFAGPGASSMPASGGAPAEPPAPVDVPA
ncbi:hypothetical protein BE17_04765 [Sorangium cellulosum]|uniref:Uncharacterized protein n=1 Tax=Sorangium cellulosum TaxID=56 RepID=A0A150R667_SORCE|nr:hypothetical protein BE17_04765 [Sorangium cellulosum]